MLKALLLLALLGLSSVATASGTCTVTASALNVRSGPSTSNSKVGLVYSGNSLSWLGSNGSWRNVRLSNGSSGWVHADYVSCSGSSSPPSGGSTKCTTAALNFRSSPTISNSNKIGVLSQGTRVTVHSVSSGWASITANGRSGYVSNQYLGSCSSSPSPGPGPAPAPAPAPGGRGSNSDPSMQPSRKVSIGSGTQGVMARIYNEYGRFISEQARSLGVDENLLAGVLQVESNGRGFSGDGRMIIRFENHVFKRYVADSTYNTYFTHNSGQSWTGHKYRTCSSCSWKSFHGDQNEEHRVLAFARSLNNEGAFKSASYGAAQIMGFNHQVCGYSSAEAMFNAFSTSIKAQLQGFINFIKGRCLSQLRSSVESFVRCYNGAGQVSHYTGRITAARDAYRAIKP